MRHVPVSASREARPRLLVLTSTYPRWPGDPEPGFVHELARRLVDRFDVTVLGPHATGALRREQMDGVNVVRYRYGPDRFEKLVNDGGIVTNLRRNPWMWLLVPSFVLALLYATWREVRRSGPDVIHSHWIVPQGLALAILAACGVRLPRFVVTSHGADLFALRGRIATAIKRRVLRGAAVVTVVSEAMRAEVSALGVSANRVAVEPMGVDLEDRFKPDAGVQRSDAEILFVGRLVEKKGLRHLLDAMPQVLREVPSARLMVAGFGPELEPRRAQAESLGINDRVNFIGAVRQVDLPDLYRRAALFVAPFVRAASGDQEGLGLVLVEAVGCGCPLVVSDLPATRDLGPSCPGLTRVQPGDVAALAAGIVQMLVAGSPKELPDVSRFAWTQRANAYAHLLAESR